MSNEVKNRKKLIEVALPLEAINEASAREKSIRHGHPSTLHLWWARRPLAAARAVIFAQMVDDPSAVPELFPTEEAQDKERQRLFGIIKELVLWENTTNQIVLNAAREEICKSWRRACADNKNHQRAKELFNPDKLPAFHDPFAGGGSLPLEAQRLGLEAYASDLNPVAVLINKAMIEIPPKFAGKPPVNPESRKQGVMAHKQWHGAQGLAEDVRYYGKWMRDEAEKRIGRLYPKVEITAEIAKDRSDLKPLIGRKLTVVAWLWARTVKSPNPAFANLDVPLASTFMLSTKPGKEAYIEPITENGGYRFIVHTGKPKNEEVVKSGTKVSRGSFRCVLSGVPITYQYIDNEANSSRMGVRLMAIVARGDQGRVFLPPTLDMENAAKMAQPTWKPETPSRGTWASNAQGRRYGFQTFGDYFSARQLVALKTFSDLVEESRSIVKHDADAAGVSASDAYADAISVYLAFSRDKVANWLSTISHWWAGQDKIRPTFTRQAIPMTWDYSEANPLSRAAGDIETAADGIAGAIAELPVFPPGIAEAHDARQIVRPDALVSTDPPYYDNVGYADLSDYFYVWLRYSLRSIFPDLFSTVAVPKTEELIASPYRHAGRDSANAFFLEGMTTAIARLRESNHPAFPLTIYYAFKQADTDEHNGTASTGWDTFLDAAVKAGLSVCGTWPIRTENAGRMVGQNTNALASSIVLVCQPRAVDAPISTRRQFMSDLKAELPAALKNLQGTYIAPVDLAQAAIGPGMAIYTRYSKVVDAEGKSLRVREALTLINRTLDEVLAEQEGDFDADTRWAVTWFEQSGFADGEYGDAETLSKAKNTSVSALEHSGILKSKAGKVRLLRPEELASDWNPIADSRLMVWEAVHQLIRRLEKDGEAAAAELARVLGGMAETARELAYRLYMICERKKRAQEALSYNALVQSWPEIARLAKEVAKARPQQAGMFS